MKVKRAIEWIEDIVLCGGVQEIQNSYSYIATTKWLMDNIKKKYFPKPKSRWQRINDI